MITIHGTKQKEETYGLIAQAWMNAPVGEEIIIIQPNDMGGKSLSKTIRKHIDNVIYESKDKAQYITLVKVENIPDIIFEWLKNTELRLVEATGFYSMPGLFGWNKIDLGSQLLLNHLPQLKGNGCDFGCGYGYLSKNILAKNEDIRTLYALDFDDRAVQACAMNITDDRAIIQQADCTKIIPDIPPLDFVMMNPPFHDGAGEDRSMGQKFIDIASHHLKRKGVCYIVANRHMPYEKILDEKFHAHEKILDEKGFKIFKAVK